MLYEKRKRLAVIESLSGEAFETAVNSRLDELSLFNPVLEIEHNTPFVAYIHYTEETYTPESLSDRFELIGITFFCEDCPYFKPFLNRHGDVDKRFKKGYCKHYDREVSYSFRACEKYYKELLKGAVKANIAPDILEGISNDLLEGST